MFLTLNDLAPMLAYMIVVNLLESLLVLLVPVLLSIVLPRSWFYDRFITRSVSLVLLGLGYLIYLDSGPLDISLQTDAPFPIALVKWIPLILVMIFILVYLMDRVGFIRYVLDEIANRAVIFLYISIPISLLSLFVVLIRNLV